MFPLQATIERLNIRRLRALRAASLPSLSGVLWAICLCVSVAGAICISVPIMRRYEAIQKIRDIGGWVGQRPKPFAFLSRFPLADDCQFVNLRGKNVGPEAFACLRQLTSVRKLDLGASPVRDADLDSLAGWRRLSMLSLSDTEVTDGGLRRLVALPRLRVLYLNNTRVGDRGVEMLAPLSLHDLSLQGTQVTDAGVRNLMRMNSLRRLNLSHTQVSADVLTELRRTLPNLEVYK